MADVCVLAVREMHHKSRENVFFFAHVDSLPVAWTHDHVWVMCRRHLTYLCWLSLSPSPAAVADLSWRPLDRHISPRSISSFLNLAPWPLFILFYHHYFWFFYRLPVCPIGSAEPLLVRSPYCVSLLLCVFLALLRAKFHNGGHWCFCYGGSFCIVEVKVK